MATSDRYINVVFSEGVNGTQRVIAASNTDSPTSIEIKTLTSGNNTITVPDGGTTPTAVTIVPPEDNEVAIVLKGVNGDTGITLHDTDPTSISLASSVTSFVLNVDDNLDGLRLIWS